MNNSAMRLTHLPTGISVETHYHNRSAYKTRNILMKLLKSKIYFSQLNIDLNKEVRIYTEEDFTEEDWIGKVIDLNKFLRNR